MSEAEEAYSKGHQAYHDGYTLKDNPYKRGSEDYAEWKMGWMDEKSDDPYWERVRSAAKKGKFIFE